jgi:hypothetical protein
VKSKQRIALITTWFPPQKSVATNRMLAFAEYLSPDYDLEVFCLDVTDATTTWNGTVKVHYSPSNRLLNRLKSSPQDARLKHQFKTLLRVIVGKFVPNPLNGWRRTTAGKLVQRHREQPFDLLISSFSPQETHLAVLDFCKEFPGIPWIADMRDEMSKNPNLNDSQQANLRTIEQAINRHASAITSVSWPIVDDFKVLCPDVAHVVEIRNGFNHDFRRDTAEPRGTAVFKLGYFGSFYGTRKPTVLFEALEDLLKTVPGFDFEMDIVGAHHNFAIPAALQQKVHMLPAMEYADAIRHMAKMDLNVQIHPRSEQKGVFTGKLFDYISVRKPVLALVDKEDVAAQLVNEMNAGYVAECLDVAENKVQLAAAFADWQQGVVKMASAADVESLHRRFQVGKLKALITQILER